MGKNKIKFDYRFICAIKAPFLKFPEVGFGHWKVDAG